MRSRMEPLAVSRKPLALPDALVYELYGLTDEEIRIVEEGEKVLNRNTGSIRNAVVTSLDRRRPTADRGDDTASRCSGSELTMTAKGHAEPQDRSERR